MLVNAIDPLAPYKVSDDLILERDQFADERAALVNVTELIFASMVSLICRIESRQVVPAVDDYVTLVTHPFNLITADKCRECRCAVGEARAD